MKKKNKKKNYPEFDIDIVKGICPYCREYTALVSLVKSFYRCSTCGEDTEQYINGSIKYLPINIKPNKDLKSYEEK
jgi:uncharacterized protein (DUF983 family)|tara:strand:+ start:403 stop:630 length:228 start_codon:yes stop_codon:yes gene_type:complete